MFKRLARGTQPLLSLSLSVSCSLGRCLSFPPSFSMFLTQMALPPGSGLDGMFPDRLSRQREDHVQTEGHPDCLVLSMGKTQTERL